MGAIMRKIVITNLIMASLITIMLCLLSWLSIVDISFLNSQNLSVHFSIMTVSAVFGGFLFSGYSLLISTVDNIENRLKELSKENKKSKSINYYVETGLANRMLEKIPFGICATLFSIFTSILIIVNFQVPWFNLLDVWRYFEISFLIIAFFHTLSSISTIVFIRNKMDSNIATNEALERSKRRSTNTAEKDIDLDDHE